MTGSSTVDVVHPQRLWSIFDCEPWCDRPAPAWELVSCRHRADGLHRGQVFRIPATAEGFDQLNAGGHTASENLDGGALVVECDALRSENFQVSRHSAPIAIVRKREGLLSGGNGHLLGLGLAIENSLRGEIVFHFLESGKHSLAIVGDRLIVSGLSLLRDCAATACVKNGLDRRCTDGPESA